jgi:hypothetical protein
MPDLSKAAEAALPAFLELMRTASRDQRFRPTSCGCA